MSSKTYQGKPCKRGHDGLRYIDNHGCVTCARERASTPAARARHKELWDTPEGKARQKITRNQSPEAKAKAKAERKAFRQSPEEQARKKAQRKASAQIRYRRPEVRAKLKERYDLKHKHHLRVYSLKRRYNMSVEEFDRRLHQQSSMCPICGKPSHEQQRRFAVDHDHDTDTVRGLLCSECNLGIGLFKHDPQRLMNAARYLTEPAFKYLFIDIWLANEIQRLKELLK